MLRDRVPLSQATYLLAEQVGYKEAMRAETSNHQCGHGDGDAVAKYRFTKDRRRFYRTPSTNTRKKLNRTQQNNKHAFKGRK